MNRMMALNIGVVATFAAGVSTGFAGCFTAQTKLCCSLLATAPRPDFTAPSCSDQSVSNPPVSHFNDTLVQHLGLTDRDEQDAQTCKWKEYSIINGNCLLLDANASNTCIPVTLSGATCWGTANP